MSSVIIGPLHHWLEEPIQLKLVVDDGRIVDVQINKGYMYRALEKLAEQVTFGKAIMLVERICGICSNAHSLCFVQAVENLAGVRVPDRARYMRTIIAELERMCSHLLAEGLLTYKLGFQNLYTRILLMREKIMNVLETITGNRVHYSIQTIGGVRRDINRRQATVVLTVLNEIESTVKEINEFVEHSTEFSRKTEGRGILSKGDALKLDVVGPVARASGVSYDIRKLDPYAAYGEIDFKLVTESDGDVKARSIVRINEVLESCKIVRYALNNFPAGDIVAHVVNIPRGEVVSRVEAPRGENFYYVKSNGTLCPERVKIRTPTIPNLGALKTILFGERVEDPEIPAIIASIDPCIACADR
jgi:NADH-quinone oxidoreductase subunit D